MSEKQISMFQATKPICMHKDQLAEILSRYLPNICGSEQWLKHDIQLHITAKRDDLKNTIKVSSLSMTATSSLAADPEVV